MKHSASALLFATLLVATAAFGQHEHMAGMNHDQMNHDQMFADMMTKHHQDGIRMAQMVVDKGENAELRAMAQKMIDDQRRDIERMQAARGEGPAAPMSATHMMPGMMPEAEMQRDMARLEAATGHELDVAFTEVMPKHHDGAITMAKHELEMGSNAAMKDIAREIASKQTKERKELLAMHDAIAERPRLRKD